MKLSTRLPIDTFVLLLLATVGVATLLPARGVAADALSLVTKIAIGILFALYGARLSPHEAWHGVRQWRLHLMVLAVTFMLFPLLGVAARVLVPWVFTPGLYDGLLFLTLVPSTVQSSIAFTSIARGNVPAAVVSASASSMLGVVFTPLLVVALMGTTGEVRVGGSAVIEIVLQLLVPFFIGQLLRPWIAEYVGGHTVLTRAVERGSILLVVYTAFSLGMRGHVWSVVTPWRLVSVAVACVILLAVVLLLTYAIGRLARLPRGDAMVLLFCGSKKSLASGLPMALVLFQEGSVGLIMLPLMLFHQIQLLVCAVIANRLSRSGVIPRRAGELP